CVPSEARGVGQRSASCTASAKLRPKSLSSLRMRVSSLVPGPADRPSMLLGVGQYEHPVSLVRGANGASRYAVPLRVIPALGQVSEYSSDPQGKVPWDVLQEDVAGSCVANDSEDFGPKMTLVVLSEAVACDAERLAGV